jgi:uncharacterized membrane protein
VARRGKLRRSDAAATVGQEALEFLVVTVLVATRAPFGEIAKIDDRSGLDRALPRWALCRPAPARLEVIWTPADPEDSLTETDLMTTYPELRSV